MWGEEGEVGEEGVDVAEDRVGEMVGFRVVLCEAGEVGLD